LLSKYTPNTLDKIANLIAFDLYLSPYTVRYTYLPMFVDVEVLEPCGDGIYNLSAKGKGLQTTEDGLTEEQVKEELEEENEQRSKLGKPKVSLEEWKAIRSKRIKPVS
jgi:hypothetical protein